MEISIQNPAQRIFKASFRCIGQISPRLFIDAFLREEQRTNGGEAAGPELSICLK